MGSELLAHIGVPFGVALVIIILRAATRDKPIGWENCNEMAIEMAILAVGATGGIFVNPNLIKHFGENNGLYSILAVVSTLVFAAILIYRDRWRTKDAIITAKTGLFDLFLGFMCITIPAYVIYKAG